MMYGPPNAIVRWLGVSALSTLGAGFSGLLIFMNVDIGGPAGLGVLFVLGACTLIAMLLTSTWGSWYALSTPATQRLHGLTRVTLYGPIFLYTILMMGLFSEELLLGLGYGLIAGLSLWWTRARVEALQACEDTERRWLRVLLGANLSGVLITVTLATLVLYPMTRPWDALFWLATHAILHGLLLAELPFRLARG